MKFVAQLVASRRSLVWGVLFAAAVALAGAPVQAQAPGEKPMSEGEQKLEGLLKANSLLVQKEYNAQAGRWHFVIDFSVGGSGESTRMMLAVVPRLTLPNGTQISLVQVISVVTALPQGQTFSTTVVSTVANANSKVYTGAYCTSENIIIASNAAYLMEMSPDELFMLLFDLHSNRTALAARLEEVMASESLEN